MATLLFLDDEQHVLNALRRVFQDEGHVLTLTTSPEEALGIVEKGGVAVVVSDQRMPSMLGIQFLEKVKKESPETVRILLTGHADVKVTVEAINRGAVYRFLVKPWDDDELRLVVKQAMAHYELVTENRRLTELTILQNKELRELNENLENKVRERTRDIEDLNKELEKSFLGSVRVMAGLTEVYSSVIGSHSRRVAAFSKGLARKLGLSESEILEVEVAALLHDIGKMAIPADTLKKPESTLKPDEKNLLKRLPLLSETLVGMVPNMGKAARLVRHHCERFHGGGLPDRLKGQEIPLGSRIIAVADAYDNTLNTRTGYMLNTPEKVLERLRTRSPSEFDPDLVAALGQFLLEGKRMDSETHEVEVQSHDLRVGMTLSRGIHNARGILLVPADTVLSQEILQSILDYPDMARSMEGFFINRKGPETEAPGDRNLAPGRGKAGEPA